MRELSLSEAVQGVTLLDIDLGAVLRGDELSVGPGDSARVSLPDI